MADLKRRLFWAYVRLAATIVGMLATAAATVLGLLEDWHAATWCLWIALLIALDPGMRRR